MEINRGSHPAASDRKEPEDAGTYRQTAGCSCRIPTENRAEFPEKTRYTAWITTAVRMEPVRRVMTESTMLARNASSMKINSPDDTSISRDMACTAAYNSAVYRILRFSEASLRMPDTVRVAAGDASVCNRAPAARPRKSISSVTALRMPSLHTVTKQSQACSLKGRLSLWKLPSVTVTIKTNTDVNRMIPMAHICQRGGCLLIKIPDRGRFKICVAYRYTRIRTQMMSRQIYSSSDKKINVGQI